MHPSLFELARLIGRIWAREWLATRDRPKLAEDSTDNHSEIAPRDAAQAVDEASCHTSQDTHRRH